MPDLLLPVLVYVPEKLRGKRSRNVQDVQETFKECSSTSEFEQQLNVTHSEGDGQTSEEQSADEACGPAEGDMRCDLQVTNFDLTTMCTHT